MDAIDELFEAAIRDNRIHGVSVQARNAAGTLNINRSYGTASVNGSPEGRPPMRDDILMRLASASKLLTSIMALQCVQRGEIGLDDSLEKLLPEVAGLHVVTGFDEETGKPTQRPPKTPVTLRHLLSHSSGLEYAVINPLLTRFRKWEGRAVEQDYDNTDENFTYPLSFDPGAGWAYGPSLDWTTRLIARASGEAPDAYLQSHVAQPLGIRPGDMVFDIQKYPEAFARHADVVVRTEDGTLQHDGAVSYWDRPHEPSGGQGIFCTAKAYIEVLYSILADDGRLLKPEIRKVMFEPALTQEGQAGLNECLVKLRAMHVGEPLPFEMPKSHGLGGLLAMDDADKNDVEAWRRKGSLTWAGMTNTFWNIDPAGGMCTYWAFHLKPFGDPICVDLGTKFEKLAYDMARKG